MASLPDPNKKYVVLENYLNAINSVIGLKDKEIARNNVILNEVTDKIIVEMKQKDQLFGALYKEKFYGGSYYDGLKVGKPNEFDLDLILLLPDIIEPDICCSQPGFVKVEIKHFAKMLEKSESASDKFSKLPSLLDGNFLSTNNVLKWMEGVMDRALKSMPNDEKGTYVATLGGSKPDQKIKIYAKMFKGGPAFTLGLSGTDEDGSEIKLDIDLVPCFQFNGAKSWPPTSGGYRQNPSQNKNRFLVVPKKPKEKNMAQLPDIEKYWRLSFQEQERELIGGDKKVLKPALRLLKKLRDKHDHKIASYFIKTVFLWTVDKNKGNDSFWSRSISLVFMSMLKIYEEYMRSNTIPYYWNAQYNLIGNLNDSTKLIIAKTLQRIIQIVDRSLDTDNPYVMGNYLLTKEELAGLNFDGKLTKKQKKQLEFANTSAILKSPSIDVLDSGSSDSPPLRRLGFDSDVVKLHRQYSDSVEQYQQHSQDEIMAQINGNNVGIVQVLNFLKKIDEKVDKLIEKVDQALEFTTHTNNRVALLEEKVKKLDLKSRLNQANGGEVNSCGHDVVNADKQ